MNIFFRENGQGTPVILIHGFCETHHIWDGFSDQLAKHARVFSIDLPGFGNSPLPHTPLTIDSIADIVLTWLKDNHIEAFVLVGHSLGGYVALAMASKEPALCKCLVLLHSTIYADTDEKKANRDKVIDFVIKNGVEPFIQTFASSLFYNKTHPEIGRVRNICLETPQQTLIEYTRAMRDRPSREDFCKSFIGTTLIIAGEKDEIIPLEISKKMASIGKKCNLLVLPDTGHMGMIESATRSLAGIKSVISIGLASV